MYETMTVKELRAICKERGIKQQVNGKKLTKDELIEKLQQSDRLEELQTGEKVDMNNKDFAVEKYNEVEDEPWDDDVYTGEETEELREPEETQKEEKKENQLVENPIEEKHYDRFFAHTLDELKQKYLKPKQDWVYNLLRIDSKVVFIENVKAKNGNEYEKLRSGYVVAVKKEKEGNAVYARTFYGNVHKMKVDELLYILEPGCESYRFPKDIRVFLKKQRTTKGAADIVQRFKN